MEKSVDVLIDEARKADDVLYEMAGVFLSGNVYTEFRKLYISTRNKWIAATAKNYRRKIPCQKNSDI